MEKSVNRRVTVTSGGTMPYRQVPKYLNFPCATRSMDSPHEQVQKKGPRPSQKGGRHTGSEVPVDSHVCDARDAGFRAHIGGDRWKVVDMPLSISIETPGSELDLR